MPMMVSGTRHGDIGLEPNDIASRGISSIESKGGTFTKWRARRKKTGREAGNHKARYDMCMSHKPTRRHSIGIAAGVVGTHAKSMEVGGR
jgi:hypothetical protein